MRGGGEGGWGGGRERACARNECHIYTQSRSYIHTRTHMLTHAHIHIHTHMHTRTGGEGDEDGDEDGDRDIDPETGRHSRLHCSRQYGAETRR